MREIGVRFDEMTREQLQAHFDERSVNTHDAARVAGWFSEDAVQRRVATGEVAKGREEIHKVFEELFRAFPDVRLEVRDVFTAPGRLCMEATIRGTHHGEWRGVDPTHKAIEVDWCVLFRVDPEGVVTEETVYGDSATMLRQLGLLS